jgi:GNAT superfamily N-acetyltransferase
MSAVTIRPFQPGDEAAFRRLNEEWITRYFKLEPTDEQSFADPQGKILDPGGAIFLAFDEDQPIGCCALIPMARGEFEVAKMAVTPTAQGSGIGRRLLEHAVDHARSLGATRLYLETNHMLTPALRLYAALGFTVIPEERLTPSPYARADVFMELVLTDGRPARAAGVDTPL